jgi:hypothetical protein
MCFCMRNQGFREEWDFGAVLICQEARHSQRCVADMLCNHGAVGSIGILPPVAISSSSREWLTQACRVDDPGHCYFFPLSCPMKEEKTPGPHGLRCTRRLLRSSNSIFEYA